MILINRKDSLLKRLKKEKKEKEKGSGSAVSAGAVVVDGISKYQYMVTRACLLSMIFLSMRRMCSWAMARIKDHYSVSGPSCPYHQQKEDTSGCYGLP